jgi:hypothetical protein
MARSSVCHKGVVSHVAPVRVSQSTRRSRQRASRMCAHQHRLRSLQRVLQAWRRSTLFVRSGAAARPAVRSAPLAFLAAPAPKEGPLALPPTVPKRNRAPQTGGHLLLTGARRSVGLSGKARRFASLVHSTSSDSIFSATPLEEPASGRFSPSFLSDDGSEW